MSFRSLAAGLRRLLRRRDVDAELEEELAHFVEQATQENVRAGMSPAAAARAARAHVGSLTVAREEALSSGWDAAIESLFQDVRYGARALRRSRAFTAAAMLTIALGVGANTAMFSVVNAVMLRPLPWREAKKLVFVWTDDVRRGLHREPTAYRTITDWRSANHTFQDIAYYSTQRVALMPNAPGGDRGRSRAALVSVNLFGVLGAAPALGRGISRQDEAERAPVVVISHGFWQRWFGGAADVIGQRLVVDDQSTGGVGTVTVIGVMPPGFYFPDRLTELWAPATTYSGFARERAERFPSSARRWTAVGRLAPRASIEDARADLSRIGGRLASLYASDAPDFPGFATTAVSAIDSITGERLQSALWTLLGAVSLVLLIACVNVANLLLARGTARRREFALRRALGAGRGRVVRQLVVESTLLSVVGGVVGMIAAAWGTTVLGAAAAGFVPRVDEITTDWRVLGFGLLASIVSGVAFGLAPALRLSSADATEALGDGGRGAGSRSLRRSRHALVVGECALALVLLTGAGLLLRSLEKVQAVPPGFDPRRVLMVRIEFPTEPSATLDGRTPASQTEQARARARVALARDLVERVRALPGVADAGFVDDLFLNGGGDKSIAIPGRTAEQLGTGELNDGSLTRGFFSVLRVPLRRGRLLTRADQEQKIRTLGSPAATDLSLEEKERVATPEPVVVNEAFARRFFPGEDPLGKRFCIDPTTRTYWYQIVGVIGDMHRQGLEREVIPEYYGPWIPSPNGRVDLLVRTTGDPLAAAASMRPIVKRVIPGATVVSVSTAESELGGFSALRRLQTWLLTIFAFVAIALAAVGIYGLVHFMVSSRRREIGVRVALGARPRDVARLVVGEGMRGPAIGILIGLAASLALARFLSGFLYGIGDSDPATLASVTVTLVLVAAIACGIAARQALRIDPARAIRDGS